MSMIFLQKLYLNRFEIQLRSYDPGCFTAKWNINV